MTRLGLRSIALLAALVGAISCRSARPAPSAPATGNYDIRLHGDFKAPLGVQLYTFRELAKTDPVGMLHLVRRLGITHVEGGSTYGMTMPRFLEVMHDAGLRTTSMLTGYDNLKKNPDTVIATAKALGAKYVGIAWYPHTDTTFTEADARRAIADFNMFGRQMKDAGLTFIYHNHGYEPRPYGDGTLLDLIIRETDPALVKFEMDVLWTWFPGQDPVALIKKYPGRFKLMHIKDMKPEVARGSKTGALAETLQAPIGEGQVPWAALMAAAEKDGFEYYYIEDETPQPVVNVPKYISYLEQLKY